MEQPLLFEQAAVIIFVPLSRIYILCVHHRRHRHFAAIAESVRYCAFLKAKWAGRSSDGLPLAEGSIAPDLLRVCAEVDDYSLLGEDLAAMLAGVGQEEDSCKLSCTVDSAMFLHALRVAKKKHCGVLAELYCRYAVGRNRLTALRLRKFPMMGERASSYAYLPVEWDAERRADESRTDAEVMQDCNRELNRMMTDLGYDNGMGVLAQYYFTKKSEAAALRLLFTEKSLSGKGGSAL